MATSGNSSNTTTQQPAPVYAPTSPYEQRRDDHRSFYDSSYNLNSWTPSVPSTQDGRSSSSGNR